MKKLLNPLFLLVSFFALTISTFAEIQNTEIQNWEVPSFHSDITIDEKGKVSITENIVADFTNEAHRGVGRSIPYEYTGTGLFNYNAQLKFLSATDENGNSQENDVYKENGYLNVDMYAPGGEILNSKATFVLKYTADNVIGFFDDHDEFYWNVNGVDWVVPMKKVSATIHLPKNLTREQLNGACFTGEYGSTEKNCEISTIDGQTMEFKTTKPLNAYENLTIVVGMPPKTITPPSQLEKLWRIFIENWGIPFAILTFIIMFYIWRKHGRDDQSVSDTIMPHYEPPKGMSPTETGIIIDENMEAKDVTATILDYAIKGFIRINEIETKGVLFTSKDCELELLKPYITTKEHEKIILSAIFTSNEAGEKTKISELKNKFYVHIPKIEKSVMEQLIKDDYFPHNPATVRKTYMGIGTVIAFSGAFIGNALFMSPASTIGIFCAGVIVAIFGYRMPRKTKKGTETYYQLKGLFEYINTAEKDRMKFQEENNIMFEKLLPYAMAFGLIEKWAKAFDGLIQNPPNWYHTNRPWGSHGFTMIYFANSLNSLGNDLSQSLASRPGGKGGGAWSGGSGFSGGSSGGGFGGGGGHGL